MNPTAIRRLAAEAARALAAQPAGRVVLAAPLTALESGMARLSPALWTRLKWLASGLSDATLGMVLRALMLGLRKAPERVPGPAQLAACLEALANLELPGEPDITWTALRDADKRAALWTRLVPDAPAPGNTCMGLDGLAAHTTLYVVERLAQRHDLQDVLSEAVQADLLTGLSHRHTITRRGLRLATEIAWLEQSAAASTVDAAVRAQDALFALDSLAPLADTPETLSPGIAALRTALSAAAAKLDPPEPSTLVANEDPRPVTEERITWRLQKQGTGRARAIDVRVELDLSRWQSRGPALWVDTSAGASDADRACAKAMLLARAQSDALDPLSGLASVLRGELTWLPWQRALAGLEQAAAALGQPEDAGSALRWRLVPSESAGFADESPVDLVVGRADGRRSRLSLAALCQRTSADSLDGGIARLLRDDEKKNGYRTSGAVLGALDRLFAAGHRVLDQAGNQLDITSKKLRIAVDQDPGALGLRVMLGTHAIPPSALGGQKAVFFVDSAMGAVLVARVPPVLGRTLAGLSDEVRFPPEAADRLVDLLGKLDRVVDVALPPELAGMELPADSTPVVRLWRPRPGVLDVRLGVRPLADGPFLRPADGTPELHHAGPGGRYRTVRSLDEERARAVALRNALRFDDKVLRGQWRARIENIDDALDLVRRLRTARRSDKSTTDILGPKPEGDLPELPMLRVEWADCAPLSATAIVTSLDVHVAKKRDWFDVEGKLTGDDASVLLADAVDALASGRRYVALDENRFVALTDTLRRDLDRLAIAADGKSESGEGLRVGTAAALALSLEKGPGNLVAMRRSLADALSMPTTLSDVPPAGLQATLRDYQREGLAFLRRLAAWALGGVLADDMGLGKTVQTIGLLLDRAPLGPQIVIAPTSVGPNWASELERFAPGLRVQDFRQADREDRLAAAGPHDVFIASYALLRLHKETLEAATFVTAVFDEAQALKNARTQTARAAVSLPAALKIALTGTPMENHLGDLWSIFRVVNPGLFGSYKRFSTHYALPIEKHNDVARQRALRVALGPFVLRRRKRDVAPELPDRIERVVPVALSADERHLYDRVRRDVLNTLSEANMEDEDNGDARFVAMAGLTRLRQLACHPALEQPDRTGGSSKLTAIRHLVDDLRAADRRVLIFSQFTRHLDIVEAAMAEDGHATLRLDGRTGLKDRQAAVASFQRREVPVFLISLKAGGTGLNLTAADDVLLLDPWWNPAAEAQAADRAHRIGRTGKVTVHKLVTKGTVEEGILDLQREKAERIENVIEGTAGLTFDMETLTRLLGAMRTAGV